MARTIITPESRTPTDGWWGTADRPNRTVLVAVSCCALAAFIVLTVFIAPHPLRPPIEDQRVEAFAEAHRRWSITVLAQLLSWLGSGPVLVFLGAAGVLVLWRRLRHHTAPLIVVVVLGATAGLVVLLKIAIHRGRPNATSLLGTAPLDYSFPSGHTADSAVVYVLLGVVLGWTMTRGRRLLLACVIGLAVLIACSRIYLGYHYLSDVIGGWLLATAIITGAMAVLARVKVPPARPGASGRGGVRLR